ncbi:RidA family protein [Paludicola sp. MB14-C6]|uniref:RidA family protein n=1 Tax=Paludihabitans sp. MB14-C6 TaxID=3070656 RepID=UPI0027DAD281|nr:RidA family protein [Paludicola sp. MB14-C6]WMJ23893.1 RidA family protein [Paludicola sp. MB14-C6]
MQRKQIATSNAPSAIGPYSQAIQIGNLLYTSGQIPINPKTGLVIEGGIEIQTKQVFQNLEAILKEANSSFEQVVKVTVFVKNMNDFAKINEIYATYFTQPYPARSCIEVSRLPKDVLVEIEIISLITE